MAKVKKSKAELKLEQSIKTATSLIKKQTGESAPRAKKQTPLELEFNKQVKRIKSAMRRLYKQKGVVFTDDVQNILKRPQRLTKAHVEKLKTIKPSTLKGLTPFRLKVERIETNREKTFIKETTMYNADTNETIEQTKEVETDDFVDEADHTLISFEILIGQSYESNPKGKHIIEQWWDKMKQKAVRSEELATILKVLSYEGWLLTYRMMYNESFALAYIADFEHNLPEEFRMTDEEIRMLNASLVQSTRAYETIAGDADLIERLKLSNSYSKKLELSRKF